MKNFFSYFTNIKVIAIMMIFGIFVGTAGYVFAQVYLPLSSYNYRASDLTSGTVNVTPNGSTNIDADTARASYIISYTDIKTRDKTDEAPGLLVRVPLEARDIQFTLIGTTERTESEFMTEDRKYTEKAANVNFPLTIRNVPLSDETFFKKIPGSEHEAFWPYNDKNILMPTAEEINAGTANANVVIHIEKMDGVPAFASNFDEYYLPRLHSAHPVAVRLDYTIDKKTVAQHVPIRAFKTEFCNTYPMVLEPVIMPRSFSSLFVPTAYANDAEMPIPVYPDTYVVNPVDDVLCSILTHGINGMSVTMSDFPNISDIAVGDFDEHGLYLGSDQCSVTRNLSRWDKIGVDITPTTLDIFQQFNLALSGKTYYGATPSEDLCDQAVVTIPAK